MGLEFGIGDLLWAAPEAGETVLLVLSAGPGSVPLAAVGTTDTAVSGAGDVRLEVSLPAPAVPAMFQFSANRVLSFAPDKVWARLGQAPAADLESLLRAFVLRSTDAYYEGVRRPQRSAPFQPGSSPVPVSGRVYDNAEMRALTETALDFWLTTGRFNEAFEKRFAAYLGSPRVMTTNSGSSANLLCLAALTSPKLGDRALRPGDEVITVAAGFPTTVNPILQYGLVPVFVDVAPRTYNLDPGQLEGAVSGRTRAIMAAHTLGNPFAVEAVLKVAARHGLWVIEDCCDALGAEYDLPAGVSRPQGVAPSESRKVGSFGHLAAFSFYPAHHITMGEGGAVAINAPELGRLVESFRDWGRDCWCAPGHDNSCGCRFQWKLGDLPRGYDHKYVYSHVGFNLKITDMQAAVALAQMDKLGAFINVRRRNFDLLSQGLADLTDRLLLPEPTPGSMPSWFGFPITLGEACPLDRETLMVRLNGAKIGTRLLFGGNLTRQPYMKGQTYRQVGDLKNTDVVMNRTFWLGVYPGLDESRIAYIIECMKRFLR